MNFGTLLDATSAGTVGFGWLREEVAPVSEYGERVFATITPFRPGSEEDARRRAHRVAGVASALDVERLDAIRDALRGAPDAAGAIAHASMGSVLSDAHLLELMRFGDAVQRVDALTAGVPGIDPLASESLQTAMRAIELGRAGKFGFYLSDAFDAVLASARARLGKVQAELDAARGRAVAGIGASLNRDDLGDEFIVMRDELQTALPPGVRVLREAPTYLLCALEYDDATLDALARRDAAADSVATAEESVREALSSVVRERAAALDATARAFGEIDVLIAAARFARAHDCTPATMEDAAVIAFEGGRFLPLAEELEVQGRAFAPLDVELGDVAVLTGPNMGGKSVCLRTCGFIAACAAFGLPVPARNARTALFDEIAWLGIGPGSGQAEEGLLSSFAQEVVRLRELLERNAPRPFVLIDEFARTTTPQEGKALLVAVVERLRARGAIGMAATHLAGVARAAGVEHFAVRGLRGIPRRPPTDDLNEALGILAESMDYRIARVESEEGARSDAIALAALLGLDAELVERAHEALSEPA